MRHHWTSRFGKTTSLPWLCSRKFDTDHVKGNQTYMYMYFINIKNISADPSARGSAPGSYDAKCVLTEPATCGLHGLGTKPAGVRGPPRVLEAHSAPNVFRRQYFGIVRGRWFAWFGHESCCCSAVSQTSHIVHQHVAAWWLAGFFFVFSSRFQKQRFGSFLAAVSHGLGTIFSFFLMGSKSDVSAFFRLRFGNCLGAKPAGVLPFRMRAPNTFFLRLAWWLAGFQVLRCAVPCLRQPFATFFLCF